MIKQREDLAQFQEEVKVRDKENQQRIREQMEQYIKEHQGDRNKEMEERKALNEFLH